MSHRKVEEESVDLRELLCGSEEEEGEKNWPVTFLSNRFRVFPISDLIEYSSKLSFKCNLSGLWPEFEKSRVRTRLALSLDQTESLSHTRTDRIGDTVSRARTSKHTLLRVVPSEVRLILVVGLLQTSPLLSNVHSISPVPVSVRSHPRSY